MRLGLPALATLVVLAGAAAHATTCPERWIFVMAGDRASPGSVYYVHYCVDDPYSFCEGGEWYYLESGALPGAQTGADQVLLGASWGHDHRCRWPVVAERDVLLF